jgi:hypothetical protein
MTSKKPISRTIVAGGKAIVFTGSAVPVGYMSITTFPEGRNPTTRQLKIEQMREVLFELGYVSSHPRAIYIECSHP